MRIFVGPLEISGIGNGLVKGFLALGENARLVLSFSHAFEYGEREKNQYILFWQYLGKLRSIPNLNYFLKISFVVAHRIYGCFVLIWTLFKFDAYIFLYGRTLTDTKLELMLLRWIGKKVIIVNMGSDIRPPYMDGVLSGHAGEPDLSRVKKITQNTKRRVIFHERYSDFIIAQPSNAQFYERPIINWFSIGIPKECDISGYAADRENEKSQLRILHSPSNSGIKGSAEICRVIEQLIDDGFPLELVCLRGVSNNQVLHELKQCDLVVDQLYSDIPMSVLGAEAASFGKPCLIAGYLAEDVGLYVPPQYVPPSFYVRPDQLRSAIINLIDDTDLRHGLGKRAKEYISNHWSEKAVAERYLMLLNGEPKSEWWYDPAGITYVGGCGMPLSRIKNLISSLVSKYGVKILHVDDKPKLEQALLQLTINRDLGRIDA